MNMSIDQKSSNPTYDTYKEFLERSTWGPAENFHNWNTRAILKAFQKVSCISPDQTSIVEIGAGSGRGGRQASRLGFKDYLGIEPQLAMADHCKLVHNLRIVSEGLPNLTSIQDESFDALFAIHVLEHAPTYETALLWVKEMLRILKPGGRILLVAPDIRDCGAYFWDQDWSHGYPTTPLRVTQLLQGLDVSIEISTTIRLGSVNPFKKCLARLIALLIPTRLVDSITIRVIGRPLASGLKIATLWGSVFIVGRK
jgi:SAM-dependent methyltransferase